MVSPHVADGADANPSIRGTSLRREKSALNLKGMFEAQEELPLF
jgi:hypothetical protein